MAAELLLDHQHGYVGGVYARNPGRLTQARRAHRREPLAGLGPQVRYARVIKVGWDSLAFEFFESFDLSALPFNVAGISGSYLNSIEDLS